MEDGVFPEHLMMTFLIELWIQIQEFGAIELFNHIILQAMKYIPINPVFCKSIRLQ